MTYDKSRLMGLGFSEEAISNLDFSCWSGYKQEGTKMKGNRKVPNCVPVDEKHKEGDIATAEMTPNYLPAEPIPGGGDRKNPEMGEHKIRMPRMEEIGEANEKDGKLAMMAAPNYNELNPYDSDEPNARMIITQLRIIREKVDSLLGMLYPDDNLEPWVATKIANSSMAVSAVSDYLRFGGETQ